MIDLKNLPKVAFTEPEEANSDLTTAAQVIQSIEKVKQAKARLDNCQLRDLMQRFIDRANRLIMEDMAAEYREAEAEHYSLSDMDPHVPQKRRIKTTEIDNRPTN